MVRAWQAALALAATCIQQPADAWGNDGHKVVGLIAQHYLSPADRAEIQRLLDMPIDPALAPTMEDRATWADAFRDSDRNTTKVRYNQTHNWHFVDLDIDHPDMRAACFGDLPLPAGTVASAGPANDCVVRKIEAFQAELSDRTIGDPERAKALMFLLHFVGDVHQPLHAAQRSDRMGHGDQGGNAVPVVVGSVKNGTNLHSYWDSNTVKRLGSSPETIAQALIDDISPAEVAQWQAGGARDWAMESSRSRATSLMASSPPGRALASSGSATHPR